MIHVDDKINIEGKLSEVIFEAGQIVDTVLHLGIREGIPADLVLKEILAVAKFTSSERSKTNVDTKEIKDDYSQLHKNSERY